MKRIALTVLALFASATLVSASDIHTVPCLVLTGVWNAVSTIGPTLVLLMMVYGTAKWLYSAEDPSGKKQGKDIFIHAIIGGIIMLLVVAIVRVTGVGEYINSCGITGLT